MSSSDSPQKSSSDETSARPRPGGISRKKKALFSLLAAGGFFVLLELVLAACGVRPVLYGEDPYVGFSSYIPLYVDVQGADGKAYKATAPNKRTFFNEQQFRAEKPPGTFRIFCLGGSTTYGRPYDDATSFSGWLREFLPAVDGSRRWEVINAGGISYAGYRVAKLMEELVEYEPDLFIIYTGHNEFLERRTYASVAQTPETLRNVGSVLAQTRTFSLLRKVIAGSGGNGGGSGKDLLPGEVDAILDRTIGPEAYRRDDRLQSQVVNHFRINLDRMLDIAHSADARVILIAPACNLRDFSPFKSRLRDGAPPEAAGRLAELLGSAKISLAGGKADEAILLLEKAVQLDDRFAESWFLLGRALLAAGRVGESRLAFLRARDEDLCPLRAISALERAVEETAENRGVPLVDFPAEVKRLAPDGIPGSESFLDHVHPTVEGHRRLATALLKTMKHSAILQNDAALKETALAASTERVNGRVDQAAQGRALVNLSKTLGWAGRREEANRLALRAVELLPDDPDALYQAGNAWYERGELDAAERAFRRATEVRPAFASAWYGLGLAASARNNPVEAQKHFREAVRLDPDFGDAHYNLGNVLLEAGDAGGAARHFRETIRLQPENHYAYNNLGVIAANQRNLDEARRWFEQALALNGEFVDAHVNLGRLHHEQGERELAREHYRAALRQQPDHPRARLLLERLGNR